MKLSDEFTEKALVFASKISSQKHMCAIKNAFTSLMPVIITGSFCTLITNVVWGCSGCPCSPTGSTQPTMPL